MNKKTKTILLISVAILLIAIISIYMISGNADNKKMSDEKKSTIIVSILPLKYLVDRITNESVEVQVLVPSGASPESYEPTPKQLIDIDNSKALFTIGLIDFEAELVKKVAKNSNINIGELYKGVELLEGSCSHVHTEDSDHHHEHSHGIDPHIWTSPKALKQMSTTLFEEIALLYPDSVAFKASYTKLLSDIERLDSTVNEFIKASNKSYFIVYHPAMTYYANDYGISQIALEQDGKEPSAEYLRNIISKAKEDGIDKLFIQKQFNSNAIKVVADDIGAEIVEIDPLSYDLLNNILDITKLITQ